VTRLKRKVTNVSLRTSVIVGFPGETEDDFNALIEGVKLTKFTHLGVFKYSDEEGTKAFSMDNKVSEDIIEDRYKKLYQIQEKIVKDINNSLIGTTLPVIIEGTHEETEFLRLLMI
jgi:ribosomal protein S12 methylthiotransferase